MCKSKKLNYQPGWVMENGVSLKWICKSCGKELSLRDMDEFVWGCKDNPKYDLMNAGGDSPYGPYPYLDDNGNLYHEE